MAEQPTADLLALARNIWGDQRTGFYDMPILLTAIVGDLARSVRTWQETGEIVPADVQRELGNLILSATRWADDLGLDPDQCVTAAAEAQRAYVTKLEARRG